jgi:hypothetical protein
VGAFLIDARLGGADLSKAALGAAVLIGADLREANLREADLRGANFRGANVREANLSGARVAWGVFDEIDLSVANGLETMTHEGPSTIGINTIYKSHGNLPHLFLRGAGVPENFIPFIASLFGKQTEFNSCFISYSTKDREFANRLYADLQAKGVRCWYAPEDMKTGDPLRICLDDAIRRHEKLLLVLSATSVVSAWVEQEVETALARERATGSTMLFPIRIDNTVMGIETGWPALVKNTRQIGDFIGWKNHDSYQKAFERLLQDLKAEAK